MKRLPVFAVFIALVALSASCAYWGLQLFKPQQRPLAAVVMQAAPEPAIAAAKGLFGGDVALAVVSNYQLRGVVAALNGRGSVAIIAAEGQPAKAYPVGAEVASGVRVQEVQARHVMLSEGGVPKRLDLMADAKTGEGMIAAPSASPPPQPQAPIQQEAPPPSMQPGMPPVMPAPVSGTR
ncbi:MAG: type II secretion system protein N [Pseudomonadota bacterium]